MRDYYAHFEPDTKAGGFVVTFPGFDFGVTQGETFEEALDMARDALTIIISDYIANNRDLPAAKTGSGLHHHPVRLPVFESLKIDLYCAFRASRLTKAELARRLAIPRTIVDRLFDLHHRSRLDQLEAAFHALGKELVISTRDAA